MRRSSRAARQLHGQVQASGKRGLAADVRRHLAPERLTAAVLALMDGLHPQQQLEREPLHIDAVLVDLLALLTPI
jgi:hypothetical protein